MASVEATTTPFDLPTVTVAIAGDGNSFTPRVAQTLTESGCELRTEIGDGLDIVVCTHRRSDSAVCAEIREQAASLPSAAIVLVVEQAATADVRRALEAGAHAVVTESSIEGALVPSIRAALAGQVSIPAQARRAGRPKVLTAREKQILGLVVMGLTNAEIASKLFLAESTVKSHLSSAFAKLSVASRSEAAAVILDPQSGVGLGILTIPSK